MDEESFGKRGQLHTCVAQSIILGYGRKGGGKYSDEKSDKDRQVH